MDSREGDSLALVAIKKGNPGSKIDTLTGINAWQDGNPIMNWYGLSSNNPGSERVMYLKLPQCGINTLPSEIGNLKKLYLLDFHNNNLSTLPKEFGMIHPGSIDFSYNQLTNYMFSMSYTNDVNLSFNNLTTISPFDSSAIFFLRLSHNKLTTLPQGIKNLHSLKELYIDDNLLTEIPKEIGEFAYTFYCLDISRNKLMNLPQEIVNLSLRYYGHSGGLPLPQDGINADSNDLQTSLFDSSMTSWLDTYDKDKSWRTTQKSSTPILPQTTTSVSLLTATISGNSLNFTGTVPVGNSVSLFNLFGRQIVRGTVNGSSFAVPELSRGVYIAEIFFAN